MLTSPGLAGWYRWFFVYRTTHGFDVQHPGIEEPFYPTPGAVAATWKTWLGVMEEKSPWRI